jgi:membrane-bound serine protease (ClpP class)
MRTLAAKISGCLALFAISQVAAPQTHAASKIIAVDVDGIIHPITAEIIGHVIAQAESENATAILLRLNTPGGLLDSTREITSKMVASRVPVIAYVTPSGGRAASAGFFLLESADIAAMSPGTNTGAASPVLMGEQMDPVMRSKIENDASAWLRSIEVKRGRNADLAEKTIREAKAFTEKEALDNHLIDLIAADQARLLADLDGREITRFDGSELTLHTRDAVVTDYRPSARERIISEIADPNIAYILLVLGALGIYVEFSSPGIVVAGVAGGIMVLLGLSGLAVLPINWIGAALLILGAALFVLEAKFASHGVLGGGGTLAMILGALLLINGPPEVRIHLSTALATTIPFALITMFLVSLAYKARKNKALMSNGGLIDEIGEARTALTPSGTALSPQGTALSAQGKVFVHGEYWDAVSATPVNEGEPVRVVAVDGMKLRVEPARR